MLRLKKHGRPLRSDRKNIEGLAGNGPLSRSDEKLIRASISAIAAPKRWHTHFSKTFHSTSQCIDLDKLATTGAGCRNCRPGCVPEVAAELEEWMRRGDSESRPPAVHRTIVSSCRLTECWREGEEGRLLEGGALHRLGPSSALRRELVTTQADKHSQNCQHFRVTS